MKILINLLLFVLGFFIMIFPNSFQVITAMLLITTNFFIFFLNKKIIANGYFLFSWILLSSIFIFFISISDIKLMYKFELLLKYVVFPLLWLNIFMYIKINFQIESITKILFNFSFISFFSVLILYFLSLNGYNYAEYFIADPNIDSDYFLGFTLHVYGNLIFFAAGLFILPNIYKSKLLQYLYIIIFIMVAIISARTALLVSLFTGFIILLFRNIYNNKYSILFSYIFSFIIIVFILGYYTETYLNYNFFEYLQAGSLGKLKDLGGQERTSQSALMLGQILNNPWGIGFNNIGIERNYERSFQYEVLILATILRFGIIGFTLIVLSLYPVFRNILFFYKLNIYKKFYLVGFLSIIMFSFTNPYLESFNFQWMFFCPLIFLSDFTYENSKEIKKSDKPNIVFQT